MTGIDTLPDVIPVFPLVGAVLLPRGVMPLNIFEPRYLKMVRDAMAGAKLIGIVQPRAAESRGGKSPALFDVGCIGRVTEYEETGDGRLLIELTGLRRFKVARELEVVTPYRQIVADYGAFGADQAEPVAVNAAARAALEETLRVYLDANGLSADWEAVTGADDESLITTLAAVCPFEPVEKQAILEAPDLPSRAATLTALMTFAHGFSAQPGDDGPRVQ